MINKVIKVLKNTKVGITIFHDCFQPTAIKANRTAIKMWLDLEGISEAYKKVLREYMEWLGDRELIHELEDEPDQVSQD